MNFFGSKKEVVLSTSEKDPMNPEVFPDEIRELIWRHVTVKELVDMTLVSKLWNCSIGSSLAFRKNVAIKLHSWNKEPPQAITKSNRRYEIVSISDFKVSSSTLHCLRDKNWRDVSLSVGKISSQRSFVKMMEDFATVRNLRIMSINIRELSGTPKLVLSELESLTLSDVTLDLFEMFVILHPSLRSVSLRHVSCDILSPRRVGEAVVEFLQFNPQLRDLEINYLVTNDLFTVNVSPSLRMNLKSLTLGLNNTPKATQTNIEEFLKANGNSIEHLKLVLHQQSIRKGPHEWGYWERTTEATEGSSSELLMIFNAWNSLMALNSLSIRFLQNSTELSEIRELLKHLRPNTNVNSLSIQFISFSVPFSIVIEFMKLLPNLKSVYATKINPAIVRYAANNLKALRTLSCFSFEGECQQELIELKATRSDVNKFLVMSDQCALG